MGQPAKIKLSSYTKRTLPSKECIICQKLFLWRKKWERDWGQVKYCSERCRRSKDLK
ncbi:MAG: DUF2256 domain-containing protein [Proteobacteria bacterium]|nr:DUF2256 domain-containing protein [Pseudomonadota bacterium]MDA1332136.1 DUF2256 domain-containing protein [Pseudomonadota bacterium]